ncbi:hypothetical protein PENANT_c004G09848 [Penicillium antarcticum]|uniref:RTA1 like protein n=1 Tax=Penicillium antarcticum TaxID=416450 RepID=A0A1V6QGF5_9EURO|nr:hypothetical protein PENANT_c004G09848 [Penicillium antarcticum]
MSGYVLYNYKPSVAAAIVAIILFVIATIAHIFFAWKHRTKFLIAFIVGGILEAIGYVARAISAQQTPNYSAMPYALQSLFILIAPSLFAASVYMILGRIFRLTDGDSRSLIRATRLTKIFVLGDVLAFLIQAGGGAILSGSKSASNLKLGERIIIVGLLVQIVFFGFFVIISVIFHRKMANNPTSASLSTKVNWKLYLMVLYAASFLIMVRCIYRVAEYIQGQSGTLQSHEYFAYVFDTALVFLVMVLFLIFHPSQVVPRDKAQLDEHGLMYTELRG